MTPSLRTPEEIRLVIFDLDGTLVDSKEDLVRSVNAVLAEMARPQLPADVIASYVGQGVRALITRALGEEASEIESGLTFFLSYYRSHMLDHTAAYPGVLECLEGLRERPLAVLTNKPVRFSRALLAGLGLADYFFQVYGGDSFASKKPDAVGIHQLMAEAGAAAAETMMVGDSDTDVATGRNAGAWTCGVTYGFGAASLEQTPPDLLLDNLRELPLLLGAPS